MKKLNLLASVLILVSCFTAKAQDTATHINKKYHYQISCSRNWNENKSDEKGNKCFVAVSPSESSDDSFLENITVSVTPNIDQSLKSYCKDRINRIKFSVKDFHQVGEGDETINGNKAKFVTYTFDYDSIPMQMIAYIIVKNK